jgi:hypothetical protein
MHWTWLEFEIGKLVLLSSLTVEFEGRGTKSWERIRVYMYLISRLGFLVINMNCNGMLRPSIPNPNTYPQAIGKSKHFENCFPIKLYPVYFKTWFFWSGVIPFTSKNEDWKCVYLCLWWVGKLLLILTDTTFNVMTFRFDIRYIHMYVQVTRFYCAIIRAHWRRCYMYVCRMISDFSDYQ